ncbi:MAG: hypothetical protein WAZ18_05620 [Alphaproteobacteria bacterium]
MTRVFSMDELLTLIDANSTKGFFSAAEVSSILRSLPGAAAVNRTDIRTITPDDIRGYELLKTYMADADFITAGAEHCKLVGDTMRAVVAGLKHPNPERGE